MPLNAKVSPLIENRKRGLAISDLIERLRAKNPEVSQAFTTVQNTVNDIYQSMAKPSQLTEFTVTDPITGKQITWIGGMAKGGVSYSGAAFSNVWIGPNADPATAPFFCDGSNVVIGKNGVVYVQDMAGNTGATFGVTQETAKLITAATNAAPSVVTITAHGYINGDTLLIAGAVGNTAINGYRIVQGVTANTFTLTDPAGVAINGNGALSGAPTAIRYYAGVLAQVFAIGPSFAGYKLRAFADGSLRISGATIDLKSAGGEVILDPIAPAINVYDASGNLIVWAGKNGANTGLYAKNAWFGGTGPADADVTVVGGVVTIANGTFTSPVITVPGSGYNITVDGTNGFKATNTVNFDYLQILDHGLIVQTATGDASFSFWVGHWGGGGSPFGVSGTYGITELVGAGNVVYMSPLLASGGTLPSTSLGYLVYAVNGSRVKVPYYAY